MQFEEVLEQAEIELGRLVEKLDPLVIGMSVEQQIVLAIGRHADELYAGVQRECEAGEVATAMVLLRPVVEDAILVRWIERDLPLHGEMWQAEDRRNQLAGAAAFEELRRRRGRPLSVFPSADAEAMKDDIKAIRRKAVAKHEPINPNMGSLLPAIEQMVDKTDNALWEAYQIAYRSLSPYTHSGGRAFTGYRYDSRPDGIHLVVGHDWTPLQIKGLAATTFLMILESVSRVCGLGFEDEGAMIRNLVATWPSDPIE